MSARWHHPDPAVRDLIEAAQADAWEKGATKASSWGGAYLRSILLLNPYRKATRGPQTAPLAPIDRGNPL